MPPVKPRIRPVYVVPNLFTTGSLIAALSSIIATSAGNYTSACYLILLSAILDALDGPIARWTRTSSSFGLQYDSLADVVAFGVAPAFLMYSKLELIDKALELPWWAPRMSIAVCGLYVACGAIRLARFNVQVADEEKLRFTGMPIPAAAGTVISTFLVIEQYLPESETRNLHRALLGLMVVLSYLMVSTYPFPSLKGLHRRFRRSFNSLVTTVFFLFLVFAFKQHLAMIAFIGFLGYITVAVLHVIRKDRLSQFSPGTGLAMEEVEE